jgi:hypothetical protein
VWDPRDETKLIGRSEMHATLHYYQVNDIDAITRNVTDGFRAETRRCRRRSAARPEP